MPVLDARRAHEDRGPSALPCAKSGVEILYIGRFKKLRHAAERAEFRGVIQRAAAASVENPGKVFAGDGEVATKRKIGHRFAPPHCLAGFFATRAFREEDLSRGAEEAGNAIESRFQRLHEAGFH